MVLFESALCDINHFEASFHILLHELSCCGSYFAFILTPFVELEMDLDLRVSFPPHPKHWTPRQLYVASDTLISEAVATLTKNYAEELTTVGGELADDWVLYVPSEKLWLAPNKDFDAYAISSNVRF